MVKTRICILLFFFSGIGVFSQDTQAIIPAAVDDSYSVIEHEQLSIPAPGLLTNDVIPANARKTISVKLIDNVRAGYLSLRSDGSFTYYAKKNIDSVKRTAAPITDQFRYRIFDGEHDSNDALVTITLIPVNDPPFCLNDTYLMEGGTELRVSRESGVLSNDRDPEKAPLTAVLVSNVSHGVLYFNYDGSFAYAPYEGFEGDDSFTYTASDGELSSPTVTVRITIMPLLDTPEEDGEAPGQ